MRRLNSKREQKIDKQNARHCRRNGRLWNFKSLLTFFRCRPVFAFSEQHGEIAANFIVKHGANYLFIH